MNSNLLNASLAELTVAVEALKIGYQVYFPFSGSSKCDLILERDGRLRRVQVKKIWKNQRGNRVCQAVAQSYNRRSRQSHIPYRNTEIDFLIAVELETSDCWIIPLEEIEKIRSNISLDQRHGNKNNWKAVY